jgi:hypothetical protein
MTGSCRPNPCNQPVLPPSSAKSSVQCSGQTPSGQSCSLQCLPGFTPIGVLTMTCTLGVFSPDGIGYCVTVDNFATDATSWRVNPPVRVSYGTRLNITLSSVGNPPSDMVISTFKVNNVLADPNFRVPFLPLQNDTVAILVYVTSPTYGIVALTGFQATVLYIPAAELRSVCPDRILAQVPQSVVIQGAGFFASSSLKCVLNGIASFPALLTNPTTVVCDLLWLNATANQILSLYVTNDGSSDSMLSQVPLSMVIKGACESEKPGSIVTSNGCQCPAGTSDAGASCIACEDGFYQLQILRLGKRYEWQNCEYLRRRLRLCCVLLSR